MPIKLSQLMAAHVFDLDTEALGPLRFRDLPQEAASTLHTQFPDLEAAPTRDFFNLLVSLIGSRPTDSGDILAAPKVTLEEAAQLTNEDLNKFAEKFIEKNDYLFDDYEKSETKVKKDAEGRNVTSVSFGKLDIPQRDGETSTQYLQRLLSGYINRTEAHNLTSLEKWVEDMKLSSGFAQLIQHNVSLSDRLGKSLEEIIQPLCSDSDPIITPLGGTIREAHEHIEIPPIYNPIEWTNKRLDKVIASLETFGPLLTDSALLIKSMNDLGLNMAAEFSKNAKESSRQTEKTIRIAVATLIVGVIVALLGVWVSYLGYRATLDGSKNSDELTKSLIEQARLSREAYAPVAIGRNQRLAKFLDEQNEVLEALAANPDIATTKTLVKRLAELNSQIRLELRPNQIP